MREKICLVIPCYNEAKRLDFGKIAAAPENIRFVFVDDGSSDNTASLLAAHAGPRVTFCRLPANVGKAEAVRQGMLFARNHDFGRDADWLGYWDADGSPAFSEAPCAAAYAELFYPRAKAVFASRIWRLGSDIVRSPMRHLASRVFITAVSLLLNCRIYDTQCGAKLFRRDVLSVFDEPFISRWIFDLEVYFRLKNLGAQAVEYPVMAWSEEAGSKLGVCSQCVPVLRDLFKIRRRYLRGAAK